MNISSKPFIAAVVAGLIFVSVGIHTALHYLGTGAIGTTYRIAQGETNGTKVFRAECATWVDLGFTFSKSFPITDYSQSTSDAKQQYLSARDHMYTLVELRCSLPKDVTITQIP